MVPVECSSLPASASVLVESSLALFCFSFVYSQQGLNNSALTLHTWSCGLFPSMANKRQLQSHSQLPLHLPPGTIQCSWDASTFMPAHLFALCVQNSFSKVEFSHLFRLSLKACLQCIWESFILVPLSFSMRINSSFNLVPQTHCI